MSPARAFISTLALLLACVNVADDQPAAATLTSTDSGTSDEQAPAYTPDCGDEALGCILVKDAATASACASTCELPQPCPTTPESVYGFTADVADPACLLDALRTMTAPIQLVHGHAIDVNPMHGDYDVMRWQLWIVSADQAVLRTESEWAELGTSGNYTWLVGGTLPAVDAFDACASQPSYMIWDCMLAAIEWCDVDVVAGPTGDAPWCPGL